MPYYVKLDAEDNVIGASFSDAPPEGRFVEVDSPPRSGMVGATKWRHRNGQFEDTGEPWHVPGYAEERRLSYPPIGDQLDNLWQAMGSGLIPKVEPFYSQIKAVKERYPKP